MGKAARIKRERGEKFEREPKRPTGKYQTAKEQREQRRRQRKASEKHEALMAKVVAAAQKEQGRG